MLAFASIFFFFWFFARFEVIPPAYVEDFSSLHGKEGKYIGVLGEWTSNPMSPPLTTFPAHLLTDFWGGATEKVANGDHMLANTRNAVMWPERSAQHFTIPGCALTGHKVLNHVDK